MTITVRYSSIDRFSQSRSFKTLAGARRYAEKWVGPSPDMGNYYAVSSDGVGKVTVTGVRIGQLFGVEPVEEALAAIGRHMTDRMTLDQIIVEQRLEDQRAKLQRLRDAYFRASDRVGDAETMVRNAQEAKARALRAYEAASERLYAMEHPEDAS